MAESERDIQRQHETSPIRKLLDSPFILLILSLLIVFISYTIWGTIELFQVPEGQLPVQETTKAIPGR